MGVGPGSPPPSSPTEMPPPPPDLNSSPTEVAVPSSCPSPMSFLEGKPEAVGEDPAADRAETESRVTDGEAADEETEADQAEDPADQPEGRAQEPAEEAADGGKSEPDRLEAGVAPVCEELGRRVQKEFQLDLAAVGMGSAQSRIWCWQPRQ